MRRLNDGNEIDVVDVFAPYGQEALLPVPVIGPEALPPGVPPGHVAVVFARNPLATPLLPQVVFLPCDGADALTYARRAAGDGDYALVLDGVAACAHLILRPGDCLFACPLAGGGDFWRMLGMVAVMAIALYTQQHWAYGGIYGAFAAGAAVAIAGNFVVNSIFPVRTDIPRLDTSLDGSGNYGWGMPSNAWQEGSSRAQLIGCRRVAPARLAAYRFLPGDGQARQRLRMLFGICDNPIDAVAAADVFVNGNPIADWPGARWTYTRGLTEETRVIPWFNSTPTEQQVGLDLPEAERVFYQATSIHGFQHGVYLPLSSYITVDQDVTLIQAKFFFDWGDVGNSVLFEDLSIHCMDVQRECDFIMQYRLVGASTWSTYTWAADSGAPDWHWGWDQDVQVYAMVGTVSAHLPEGQYEVRFAIDTNGISGADDAISLLYLASVVGYNALGTLPTVATNGTAVTTVGVGLLLPGGIYYLANNGSFASHTVRVAVAVRPYGASQWTAVQFETITDATAQPLRRFVEFTGLSAGQWEVQAFIDDLMPAGNRYRHDVQFEFLQESIDQRFSYPGTALLAVDLPAVDTYTSGWPVVEVKAQRSNYAALRPSTNPAWAAYYRLIQTYNQDAADVNLSAFEEWAAFCDTNSLTVSLYLDTQLDMDTVLGHIAMAGRAVITRFGANWDVIIERAAAAQQTFGTDNIIADSFEESFAGASDRANTVVCWFFDKDGDYRRTPVKVRHPNSGGEQEKIYELTLYGVDNIDQATSHAILLLNRTYLTRRSMSWLSWVDAIGCRPGDVVYLQNDLPMWGLAPGRVVSANSTSVTCDIPRDLSGAEYAGRTLRILVRHQTAATAGDTADDIERLALVNPHGSAGDDAVTTWTLNGVTFDRIPAADALVLVGWVTGADASSGDELLSVKEVRITEITQHEPRKFRIRAEEYYDAAYEDDYVISTLPATESGLSVADAAGGAGWVVRGLDQVDYISLTWTGNSNRFYVFYRVETGTSQWGDWRFYRTVAGHSLRIEDLPAGHTYQFSINVYGHPNLTAGHLATVAFAATEHTDILTTPANLRCAATGTTAWTARDLDLTWDAFGEFSFDHYLVEILNAAETVVLRAVELTDARYGYGYDLNAQDHGGAASASVKVRVTVVDIHGNEQATAVTEFINAAPAAVTALATTAGSATEFAGRDVDVAWTAPADADLAQYEVSITHGGSVLRTRIVAAAAFSYPYASNQEDGAGTASATVVVRVRSVDAFGQYSGYTTVTLVNPAPAAPATLAYGQWMNGIRWTWAINAERDFDYYTCRHQVEAEGWSAWRNIGRSTLVDLFLTDDQADTYANGATVYFEVRAHDTFGTASAAASSSGETGAVWVPPTAISDIGQLSGAFTDLPVLVGDAWTNNSPSAGYAAWNAHSLWYAGVQYAIAAGNTALRYIWWDNAAASYSVSATAPTLGAGDFVIAENISGTVTLAWDADANRVIGSAYIGAAAILDLNVGNVSAAKILANTVMTPGVTLGDYITVGGTVQNAASLADNTLALGANLIGFRSTGERSISLTTTATTGVNTNVGTPYAWRSRADAAIGPVDCAGLRRSNGRISVEFYCSDWANVQEAYFYLIDDDATEYYRWGIDITALAVTNSWQTFELDLADATIYLPAYGNPNVSEIAHVRMLAYFSEEETVYFRNATVEYDKFPVLISTEDDMGKFYIGDNADVYWDFDGQRLNLAPSEINVRAGRDANFIGSDSDPGKLNFVGTSRTTAIGANASGYSFAIEPAGTDQDLFLGGVSFMNDEWWASITARAYESIVLYAYEVPEYSKITLGASGYINFDLLAEGSSSGLKMDIPSTGVLRFYPTSDKIWDLGTIVTAWDDVFADDFNNVGDFFFMDWIDRDGQRVAIDDVAAIGAIKPSDTVDPRTGLTVINDATLPAWMVVRHKADGEERAPADFEPDAKWHWVVPGDRIRTHKTGEVAVGPDGKPYVSNKTMQSLLMGAVRQLAARLAAIEGQHNQGV